MLTTNKPGWVESLAKDDPKLVNGDIYLTPSYVEPKVIKLEEATKLDAGKTDWSLMPFEAVEEINKVLEFGAKKYSAWNFAEKGGMRYSRLLNSLLRHIFAYMRGENNDPESGLSHLAHAGCNIIFLLYYTKNPEKFNKDDRNVR